MTMLFRRNIDSKGSYQTVRDNIRWLYDNGFPVSTITTGFRRCAALVDRVFSDYLKLRGEVHEASMKVNVVRGKRWRSLSMKLGRRPPYSES